MGIWSAKPSHLYELISNIDHGKNLSHHHHHTDHHILHQDNSRTRVKARAGNTGTAKDYQRPQPAEQVVLMNRDDDENNDYAGAALRF